VVDGYADLDPAGRPGLGAHAHAEFGIPVIGVAKSRFRTATHAVPVVRGSSARPLFVTASGIPTAEAADLVRRMGDRYRLPDALRRGWLASSPYARRYAHDHAAAAGLLDDLLEDPPYLAAAEPDRLLRVLPEATISRARAREAEVLLYRVGSRMRGRPDGERAAVLELGARQLGARWIADQLAKLPLGRPWSVRWTHKQPVGHDRILGWHDGPVWAVVVGERNGRAVVVSGGSDGMVRVWGLRAGGLEAEWRHGKGRVKTVTIGQLADGPVVVSGGEDGQLRRWHLADGSPYGEPLDLGKGKVTSAAIGDRDGQRFIVAGYEHLCTVGLWDLDTGQPLGELDWGSDFPLSKRLHADVRAVAAGSCNGKPVIVAGHKDGAHRWGWTGSEWAAKPLISDENIWAVAIALTIDGTARQRAGKLLGYGVGRGSRPPVVWSNLRCHVRFCAGQGQVRHSARLEPLGTRSGVGQAGVVEENRTGGASMWTSPSGLGAL
jgi:hypothetical protein